MADSLPMPLVMLKLAHRLEKALIHPHITGRLSPVTLSSEAQERKRYKYFITHGGRAPECSHDGSEDCQPWHLKEVLNVSAMQESAGAFVGEHDFHTFTSQHGVWDREG